MHPRAPLPTLALTFFLLFVQLGCAAPRSESKMSWTEAGFDPAAEAEENTALAPSAAPDDLRSGHFSPLALSTFRFAGVERVLRARNERQPMPPDALKAWSGLFAAIDRTLSEQLPASSVDLVRVRMAVAGELGLDRGAYGALPAGLEAAVQARSRALAEKLRDGRLQRAPAASSGFEWPLWPVEVTSLFGPRLDPIDHQRWKRHEGLDLGARSGTRVVAAAAGIVVDAGRHAGYGLLVAVRHADGSITRYGHLSQVLTAVGLKVAQGDPLGLVGSTGRSTGPHLHFEIWRHGKPCDPLQLLGDPQLTDESD